MKIYFALFISMILLAISCKNSESKSKTAGAETAQASFEKLPKEMVQKLWEQADLLDFIFHDLPFSMNQSEKPSIQANISYISQVPLLSIPEGCKAIARQFYGIQGEIVLEADVYFSEGCYFYVFIVDGQPKYANQMNENGKGFFKNIIAQALNTTSNMGG